MIAKFSASAIKNNYIIDRPDVVLNIIIEAAGSTCYNSILYNQPLPIEELKPYLYKAIRAILSSYKCS